MAKVLITRRIAESGVRMLADAGHEVVFGSESGMSRDEFLAALKNGGHEAVVTMLTDKIDAEALEAGAGVKIFANYAVGYDNFDLAEAAKRGVALSNTPGVLTDAVAEHAIALAMAAARRVVEADRFTRDGKYAGWDPMLFVGSELKGKTLGIVGCGRIGSRAAEIASRGFGMRIAYFDTNRNEALESALGAERMDLEAIFSQSDVVSIHAAMTEETKGMVNSKLLSLMKPSAVLVNTARGPLVDEAALVSALREKKIAAAALDVFEHEPKLSPGLADLPNVILTPHIASATIEAREGMSRIAAENVIACLAGKELPNPVK